MFSLFFWPTRALPRVLAAAVALACGRPTLAQDVPLSLTAAISEATHHAPMLEASRARWTAAREEAARAGALPDPELSVGIDNLATQGPGAFTAGGDSMTMRSVGLRQALPSRSLRRAERAVADADTELADATSEATELAIRQQVARAWVQAWGARIEHQNLAQLREAWQLDLAAAQARLRSGRGMAADVLAVRAQALELDNRLDEATSRERQARAELARWLGHPVSQDLAAPPDFDQLPLSREALLARLDQQGPLLGWNAREQGAQAALDQAQAAKHPQWSLAASYGSRVRGLSDMVTLEVGVSLPLFTRNRQDRGISARAAELDAVRDEHEDARRIQTQRVEAAWAQWQSLGQQVRRHRDQLLPLAHDRAALALAAYRGGDALQPLLDARRDQLQHHLDYARTQADYGQAWADLAYLLP